ncbi:TPA: glycosyltransferase [Pasteurella multocida]|nr:glycosyltransferase [Pasteurella multocida]HDR1549115.1 glycosyltransferase [Pasteurella multocida]HDR1886407.1 glycosyltransferase [Pasteurella multocida]HEA3278742.1 glycosyltransferase [Pasteurella multocida]HED4408650.1 glycosyltransferase [Pasteurella multocida]
MKKSKNNKRKSAKNSLSLKHNSVLVKKHIEAEAVDIQPITILEPSDDNQYSIAEKKYRQSLLQFRSLIFDYENKQILLTEQNRILNAEKKALVETVKEYETLYKEWAADKKNLTMALERAVRKAENAQQTKSFRLGYALIFGFKSWQGFKDMFRTLYSLYKERNTQKTKPGLPSDNTLLAQPLKKKISWDSQKPVLQWIQPSDSPYLSDFIHLPLSSDAQEYFVLPKEGIESVMDCTTYQQLLVKANIFSKEFPDMAKQALLTVAFYNEKDEPIQPEMSIPFSQKLGKHYFYLNASEKIHDYIFLLIPANAKKVALGLALWDATTDIYVQNKLSVLGFSDGISVVIPTFKGEKTIIKCLESLSKQTLPSSDFEVLVVINGEQDNTPVLIEQFKQLTPNLQLRVFELEEGNVSKARNFAIQNAQKGWITFIDDDDFVPENYLNALYQKALYNTISVTGIEDMIEGQLVRSNVMTQLDSAMKKAEISYFDVTSTMTMNACKLAPSYMVKSVAYDVSLRSGEDVVYWSKLLNRFRPKVALATNYLEDSYKRLVRENSVSRKAESYDFNVFQRLEVIKQLIDELGCSEYEHLAKFIQSKINAQAGFIKRYLQKFPQDYSKYLQDITKLNLHNTFIGEVNSLFTDTLVISYCFAPYIDTSGVVMSKRVRAMDKPVDLISNSMSRVRETDKELLKITEYSLGKHHELNTPQSFANWNAIIQFADGALDATHKLLKHRKMYKNLYSRAMWPASHIAAALVKAKYPQIKWTAEFSDPILMDVSAQQRFESLPLEWLIKQDFIKETDGLSDTQNLFYWCEKLPYLYADELIFTNQNQLDYMLSYADEELRETILKKAVIQPQPTLERKFYALSDAKLDKEENKFHLAYFGSFYVNRGFKPFIEAWNNLPKAKKQLLQLHIYTQQDEDSILTEVPEEIRAQIVIQKYVAYFDFLALADQFDGLIVMDTQTKELKMNNPYLPSKLSDYLGSASLILALTEQDSPMSHIENDRLLKADMHQLDEILEAVNSLLNTKYNSKGVNNA